MLIVYKTLPAPQRQTYLLPAFQFLALMMSFIMFFKIFFDFFDCLVRYTVIYFFLVNVFLVGKRILNFQNGFVSQKKSQQDFVTFILKSVPLDVHILYFVIVNQRGTNVLQSTWSNHIFAQIQLFYFAILIPNEITDFNGTLISQIIVGNIQFFQSIKLHMRFHVFVQKANIINFLSSQSK